MRKEFLKRGIMYLLSSFWFDVPLLMNLKMIILKAFFDIGESTHVSYRTLFLSPHNTSKSYLKIGNNVGIEHDCELDYSGGLEIGNNVWISEGVLVSTHKHIVKTREEKKKQPTEYLPLIIEDEVWVGARAIILPGVMKIARGAVIGAGAIVTKDVAEWTVVAGNPARPISTRE